MPRARTEQLQPRTPWRRALPVPIDTGAGGEVALFLFDTGTDGGSQRIALQSVLRSLAAILPDAPATAAILASGIAKPPAGAAHLVGPDPFRPERFLVRLQAERLVLCAVLRLWARTAPRTAVVGGTVDEAGTTPSLRLRAHLAGGRCYLPRGVGDDGAEALLEAAGLAIHWVDEAELTARACAARP
ncbi:hypothetical protein [Vulgatibacter sp.]|uniref:hypothetical protein n=1 Tax=Vulgatibacter sp. TaxID=1971226 RepID=UPI003568D7B5